LPHPSVKDVLRILHRLQSKSDLRRLYCDLLNYECADFPISTQNWPTAAKELVDCGCIIARHADFSVIFWRIQKLGISNERVVLRQVLERHPECVVVFYGVEDNLWHIVSPRPNPNCPSNFLTRRFTVGPDERLRTAAERLSLTYADRNDCSATIRQKHDTAFETETLTKEFLKNYESILETVRNGLLRERKGMSHVANIFVQQLLNRLTFLYFIEKTGRLNGNFRFIRDLVGSYKGASPDGGGLYQDCIEPLLFSSFGMEPIPAIRGVPADLTSTLEHMPFLNSELFARNELDDAGFRVADEHLRMIVEGLLERFNFMLEENLPFDVEVAIDPGVLGKVCESIVLEEERGKSGAFYTPRIEVDFMCRQALVEYLVETTGQSYSEIAPFVWAGLNGKSSRTRRLGAIRDAARHVRILDPACGSGAFLVGMIDVLVDIHERIATELGEAVDGFRLKSQIIQDNLFGVDINSWAIQAAKWRLWLKLIAATAKPRLDRHSKPLLPALEFVLRVGDSIVQELAGVQLNLRQMYCRLSPRAETSLHELTKLKRDYYRWGSRSLSEVIKEKEIDILGEAIEGRLREIALTLKNLQAEQQQSTDTAVESDQEKPGYERQKLENEHQKLNQILMALRRSRPEFSWETDFPEILAEGGFDIVVGNPPYVRHESIGPANAPFKAQTRGGRKKYKNKLARSIEAYWDREPRLNMKSDLYIYFFYHGLSLLKPGGILCFITSNSWLDVEFGLRFQKFLLRNIEIKAVFSSLSKRTFTESDVNAVVSVFKKPGSPDYLPHNTTKFVALRKSYEEVLCSDSLTQISSSTFLKNTNLYRCVPISQHELWKTGLVKEYRPDALGKDAFAGKYEGEKWGSMFLRAPDILFAILRKGSGKLVRVEEIGRVRYPIKTGINEFFYLDDETVRRFGVEREFLIPVVKSPKEFSSIRLENKRLKTFLFHCDMNKKELSKSGKRGALSYVEWGEQKVTRPRQKTTERVPWPLVPSVKGRKPAWYSIERIEPADVICNRFFDKRFFFGFADTPVIEDQTFYGLTLKKDYKRLKETQTAILNSTLSYLFVEIFGRAGLGQGVLQYATYEMRRLPTLNAKKMTQGLRERVANAFRPLANREIRPIFEEVRMKDRREMDDAIFDFINLSKAERDGIYTALTQLVQTRLEKAATFPKRLPKFNVQSS